MDQDEDRVDREVRVVESAARDREWDVLLWCAGTAGCEGACVAE